jgi:glyoxylate reductase
MTETVIVLARQLPPALQQALGNFGEIRVAGDSPAALAGCVVYVSTSLDAVPADLIEALPASVRMIANIGVGTDNIDLAAAAARAIAVSNTPVVTEDTADLTLALMLATCRRLSTAERLLRAGDFTAGSAQLGLRVHGKTLGIIGFGAIGQAVARRAHAFGMNILYHGPQEKAEAAKKLDAEYRSRLESLLGEADIVSLHCPLTADTRHLLNRETIVMTRPGAVIINTGRGPLIHEAALVEALASGHLGGAGLDVFEFEPEIHPALQRFDNVTLLPHIGSATQECRADMAMRVSDNIRHFLEYGVPLDPCNRVTEERGQ